ncbi:MULTISPECIES: integration host factor subunit alpha [Halomonadaceae]|uniref:Integration host factor subunit alpha n=1 Tax=Modicisalibacter zincidurans TaxID=1178777 RepID=A0ABP9RCK8_9GAMM|nr:MULTISPECIES: integration host factor subunit alpha [Halomonas]MCD6007089.1 integration host factor subunit alpha [Halomonas sp. IOP_31]MEA3251824.1 integration host factor subunit alpha [Pseudomonadota bacterium]
MAALTKAELAEHLHTELGVSKREAKTLVEAFFEEIRGCLRENEQVKLSGFGNFDLRDKRERPGRNPKTGEEIPISARRVVTFRPGQKLKARVEAFDGPAPQ